MAYPVKLRQCALEALRKGYTREEVTKMYGLGINTLRDWEKLERETGSLENRPLDRKPWKTDLESLRKYCEDNPLATHIEAGVFFNCSERVIRYAKKKLGITRKKRPFTTKNETNRNDKSLSKD
jgi:transposase